MALYVGIDGGGTKTRVCVVDSAGETGAAVEGGASNPISVGWEDAHERIVSLIEQGVAAVGGTPDGIAALCAAVAGIDRPDQAARLRALLHERFPAAEIVVVNDALAALASGTRGGSGVVLIAGTGTIAVGEDRGGRVVRAGGLGYLIGDEGSGFEIGRRGLIAAAQAAEGRGPTTALWPAAREVFGVEAAVDLVPAIYDRPHPVGTVASFARTVAALADSDAVAESILADAVEQHRRLIGAAFARLGDTAEPAVVLAGGFYAQPSRWKERLQSMLPGCAWPPLTYSPAAGAVLRAMTLQARRAGTPAAPTEREAAAALWERIIERVEGAS